MIHSVRIIKIIGDGEDPFEWEQELPEELFKSKYNFDGGDIGPFGDTDEPMKRTLFWYPKNSELAEELCNLIVNHGYRASRDYIPTVD
jgi:hypothetical protein